MRLLVVKIILFFLPLFLLVRSVSEWDNNRYGIIDENIFRLQVAESEDSLDILFLGSSYVYSAIDTRLLANQGIDAYNLGISGSGAQFLDLCFEHYFSSNQQMPRKVFINISPLTFSSYNDNFFAYPLHRYLCKKLSHEDLALRYNLYTSYFKMLRKSFFKGIKNLRTSPRITNRYTKGIDKALGDRGFIENCKIATDESLEEDARFIKNVLKEVTFENSKVKLLEQLIKRIQSLGSEVYLMDIPTGNLSNFFDESYLEKYQQAWVILKSQENIQLFQPTERAFTRQLYRDNDHLNCKGAIELTEELLKKLEKL